MFLTGFAAGPLAANCYQIGGSDTDECVVIDPGMAALVPLTQQFEKTGRRPVAVLISHGHFDHVADAAAVAAKWNIPVYIGAADRYMLADPLDAISAEFASMLSDMLDERALAGGMVPDQLHSLEDTDTSLELAGMTIHILHVPGHTPGSKTYRVVGPFPELGDAPEVLFTGDTLFAGSIGRTDLPGGDTATIVSSIEKHLLTQLADAVVLPGHGPGTTIAHERDNNPFVGRARN